MNIVYYRGQLLVINSLSCCRPLGKRGVFEVFFYLFLGLSLHLHQSVCVSSVRLLRDCMIGQPHLSLCGLHV